jgi:hypothetical protein
MPATMNASAPDMPTRNSAKKGTDHLPPCMIMMRIPPRQNTAIARNAQDTASKVPIWSNCPDSTTTGVAEVVASSVVERSITGPGPYQPPTNRGR